MVKGKQIKTREVIKTDTSYRNMEGLNCSMIKLFDTNPVRFYNEYILKRTRKDKKTVSLMLGDLVDFYLLDCRIDWEVLNQRFDEKFALYENKKGTGQVFVVVDYLFEVTQENTVNGIAERSFAYCFSEAFRKAQLDNKYKGGTEEKALADFNANGTEYYDLLLANIGKTVVEVSLLDKAKKIADILANDPFTKDIFQEESSHIEYLTKFVIEWVYTSSTKDIKCKSELDIIKIDHLRKIIYPKDLKTAFDNEEFEYSYLKYRYDLQAAFYDLAVKYWAKQEGLSSYTIVPMEFIVGDTSSNNRRPVRYRLSDQDIQKAMKGFSIRGLEYKGLVNIIEDICWAEDNEIWNVSKAVCERAGILNLSLKYDS